MPTIEVVSIGAETVPDLPRFHSFACWIEPVLRSHRILFQQDFDSITGVIAHLANKDFQADLDRGEPRGWFAGLLINWEVEEIEWEVEEEDLYLPVIDPDLDEPQRYGADLDYGFRFLPDVLPDICELLTRMLAHSPVGQAYFSTDFQFGPRQVMRRTNYTLPHFIDEHNAVGLRFNCLYHIIREEKAV